MTPSEPEASEAPPRRRRPRHASLLGAWLGTIAAVLTVTPSLVPRGWYFEIVLAGLTFALFYGLGAAASWAYRLLELPPLGTGPRRIAWRVLWVVAPIAFLVGGWVGRTWQVEQHTLLGMEEGVTWLWVLSPILGLAVAAVFIGLARLVYWIIRALARLLGRILPPRLAATIAVLVTLILTWNIASGIWLGTAAELGDTIFASKAEGNKDGVTNPYSRYRSAGPNSDLSWEDLTREGRFFISNGRTAEQIAEVTGDPEAKEPVRVFVSVNEAESAADRAAIAVAELRRLGGFERRLVAVGGPTGSGWVDHKAAAALEFAAHGDLATVTSQYSFLPSFMTYLLDKERAQENAAELITAIRVELDTMAPQDRPELYVFGESLGAFSVGSAFTSVEDMSTTTDGALLIGPPNFEPTWVRVQENRDPSSPIWRPRYRDGALARAATVEADLTDPTLSWDTPNRIVYLTHPSDPIVAWQVDRSEWLEQRGDDIHPRVNAIPVISDLQGSIDQFGANAVPPGHGHVYDEIVVPAWSEILGPPALSAKEISDIEAAVAEVEDPDRK